jgi:4-amino-4-deoxy-L-arabinose transferase-like glycosyltransferase
MNASRSSAYALVLAILVAAAALVRLPLLTASSASYRLTEAVRPEEVENLRISTGMLHKHSLNPHAFEYPSLFYYVSLVPEALLARHGSASWRAALIGVRSLSLLFSLGTVLVIAALARRLAGETAGLFAAAIAAFDRTLIGLSTMAKPNATQVFFVIAAFLVLAALADRPRVATAVFAAVLLALAAAAKWLGALGLAGLALAPLLAFPTTAPPGWPRLAGSLRAGAGARVAPWALLLPVAAFGLVAVLCVPYALLSPREFGFGFAQVLTAQSIHQRPLPLWAPLGFLAQSLGAVGLIAAAAGMVWGVFRALRWDGSEHDRGVILVLGWSIAYGLLLLFAFVRLPGYVDLWVPFLAVLAGCAWVGPRGLLRSPALRAVALVAVTIAMLIANGPYALAQARLEREFHTGVAAGEWLERAASGADTVLADPGAVVPDRLTSVQWNGWGGPPRVVYDETSTWGQDPAWPAWSGGHRQLWFVNAKWRAASDLLAERPRWVVVTSEWSAARARPSYASETADPEFDRSLVDGRAGYALRARFEPSALPSNPWRVLSLEKRARGSGPYYVGPGIAIYERVGARSPR